MRRPATVVLTATLLAGVLIGCAGVLRAARTPDPDPEPAAKPAPYASDATLRSTFETFPPTADAPARVRLLTSNTDAWVERWRLLAETQRSLDVTYFILHEDVFGVAFLGHLVKKAKEGVNVRLLLDAFGTTMSRSLRGNDYLDELVNTGHANVKIFRPRWTRYVEALFTLDPTVALASEHDKIIVSDGRRSLIGGRNIGVEYFAQPGAEPDVFHDTDVRLDSAQVAIALRRAFESQYASTHAKNAAGEMLNLVSRESELLDAYTAMDAWLRASPGDAGTPQGAWKADLEKLSGLRGALHRATPPAFTVETRVLDSKARVGGAATDDPITRGLVRLVEGARKTIVIQSPYLVLSEEGVEVLARAGRRGVAISVLTNSPVSSDNALSQAFFLEQWPEILARVPKMRIFVGGRERTLHDKAAVFDDVVSLVGTYNLDPTSMVLNSEVVAAVWSSEFARAVGAEPRRLIAAGSPSVYEYTIARDSAGNAVRDGDGHVRVTFGPRDHCTPERWATLGAYWTTLKAVKGFTGLSPLF